MRILICLVEDESLPNTVFSDCIVFTKNHMACLTLKLDAEIENLVKIFNNTRKNFRLIRAKKYTKIIVDQPYLEEVSGMFKKDDIISVRKDLSELRVVIQQEDPEIKGILSRISGEIAMHNVSIIEIIACLPDILIYVKESDLLKAHQAIMELTNK